MISIGELPSMYEESDTNSFKQPKKCKEFFFIQNILYTMIVYIFKLKN